MKTKCPEGEKLQSISTGPVAFVTNKMELLRLVLAIGLSAAMVHSQERVSPEDTALLDKLQTDHSFYVVDRENEEWLDRINNSKWSLYRAFHEKLPTTVKVLLRRRAGWEGQFTKTWFTVSAGKATIVEAYFGDASGSSELQRVRLYTPDKLVLGHYDKNWKCVPATRFGNSKTEELCLLYNVPSDPTMKVF